MKDTCQKRNLGSISFPAILLWQIEREDLNKHYFGFQILQVQEMKFLESLSQTNDSYYDY